MKFFLTSSDIANDTILGYLSNFLKRNLKGYKVAYITTPADIEKDKSWLCEAIDALKVGSLEVTELDIKDKSIEEIKSIFDRQDAIWICGGLAGYFLPIVYELGLDEIILEYVKRGVLYIGSSMGGMILSKNLRTCVDYIGEADPDVAKFEGFDWIDFEIYPHFEETALPQIERAFEKKGTMYLMKNTQAVGVKDGVIQVFGGNIKIY